MLFFLTPPQQAFISVFYHMQVRFFFSQLHHVKQQTHQRVLSAATNCLQ